MTGNDVPQELGMTQDRLPSRSEIEKLRARIEELERAKEDKGDK